MAFKSPAVFWLIACCSTFPSAAAANGTDGSALYERACAACHGTEGRGRSAVDVGFDIPLPDFSDCAFASREPDADWFAVVHEGGPVRAFDRMMPAFGDALAGDDIEAILRHIRTFCANRAWPPGEFNVPRAVFTEKAFPEDEAVVTVAVDSSGATDLEILYEKRFGPRGMLEVAVPLHFGAEHPVNRGATRGLGDVAIGYKHTFHHDLGTGSVAAAGAEVVLPTGDETAGIGAGATVFEPFVAYGRLLPGDAFAQLQALAEIDMRGERPDEGGLRFAVGRTWTQGAFGRAWSPILEVLAARELRGGADTRVDIVPQFQVSLNTRQHILLNVGIRVPTDGDRDPQFVVYLLWDWFDGGLFDGWGR